MKELEREPVSDSIKNDSILKEINLKLNGDQQLILRTAMVSSLGRIRELQNLILTAPIEQKLEEIIPSDPDLLKIMHGEDNLLTQSKKEIICDGVIEYFKKKDEVEILILAYKKKFPDHQDFQSSYEILRNYHSDRVSKKTSNSFPTERRSATTPGDIGKKTSPETSRALPARKSPTTILENTGKKTSFEKLEPGGPYCPDFYINRKTKEEEIQVALKRFPVLLWGPRRFGKTWLFSHLINFKDIFFEDYQIVEIDLLEYVDEEKKVLKSMDNFLLELAKKIVEELNFPENLVSVAWNERNNFNRMKALLNNILPKINNKKLILAIDHFEEMPVADSFFQILRGWKGKGHKKPWSHFQVLLIARSTTPALLGSENIKDFGKVIEMEDFDKEQISELKNRYELSYSEKDIERIMELIGGHPFLVKLLMYNAAKENMSLDELLDPSIKMYRKYLSETYDDLLQEEDLRKAFSKIASNSSFHLEYKTYQRLYSAGLINSSGNEPRYKIYKFHL